MSERRGEACEWRLLRWCACDFPVACALLPVGTSAALFRPWEQSRVLWRFPPRRRVVGVRFYLCTHCTDLRWRRLRPARTAGAQDERSSVHLTRYSLTHGNPEAPSPLFQCFGSLRTSPLPVSIDRRSYLGPALVLCTKLRPDANDIFLSCLSPFWRASRPASITPSLHVGQCFVSGGCPAGENVENYAAAAAAAVVSSERLALVAHGAVFPCASHVYAATHSRENVRRNHTGPTAVETFAEAE